ncbi:LacI family DNA-binding transcriptional regulator [Kordiimonas marina]|uniref:LacI family DNA-binding transcriptional regulator n=1 Tax=Kordiimonas marina TaxID=2872312 RepID=UPI001FF66D23|nr:LacI family DNA-binding transcriptional regulator [Kordiimonas marina]MCJ9428814.1 LacI family DNA-binding transcriptional regulator [Kordiimonas marina]
MKSAKKDTTARKPVRLEDVAEIAGVSISTVSRALSDSPLVSDATKQRILAIVEENNMVLRRKEEPGPQANYRTLELIIPLPQGKEARISDAFYLDLIGGIGDAMKENDCDFLISHHSPRDFKDLEKAVHDRRAEAFIIIGQSLLHEPLNQLARTGAPFVVWGAQLENQAYCSIGSDNKRGGYMAASHLLRLGRKKVAFIGDIEAPEVTLRYEGYCDALKEAGVPLDENLVRNAAFSFESAMETIEVLMETGVKFDGVVAAADVIAMGAIRALMRNGLSVPGDVSVIGYDDVRISAYSTPALTTIRQDVARAGRRLVSKALRLAEGEKVRSELLPTELIVRESCGA